MAELINHKALEETVKRVLEEDMNKALEATTKKVVAELEETIRRNVAARMIAMAGSHYSMEYMRGELHIKVKIGGDDVSI